MESTKKVNFLTIEKIGTYIGIVVASFTIWATLFQLYNRLDDLRKDRKSEQIEIRERIKAVLIMKNIMPTDCVAKEEKK